MVFVVRRRALALVAVVLVFVVLGYVGTNLFRPKKTRVLVSMAYSLSTRPASHIEHYLQHAVRNPEDSSVQIDYFFTISGFCDIAACQRPQDFIRDKSVSFTVLRRHNFGFDFGSHTYTLAQAHQTTSRYDYYIFLNSGVVGPFIPRYVPSSWHWTQAFISKLNDRVKLVGTSIACLPWSDLGGHGPKVECFAFALDQVGLEVAYKDGRSFKDHLTKEDAILDGEYALTKAIFAAGYSIDCFLMAYKNKLWQSNSDCNLNVHPTRPWTYFGMSVNPFEVLFHKTYWAGLPPVAEEIVNKYLDTKKKEIAGDRKGKGK